MATAAEASIGQRSLLMVRKAGAPFDSRFRIRSKLLNATLDKHADLGRELKRLQSEIVGELYECVPRADGHMRRRALLKIKRAVFNGRTVAGFDADSVDDGLSERLLTYDSILEERESLLEANRTAILADLRRQLEALLEDEEFRYLLDYSCPWLVGAHRRDGPGDDLGFSDGERGIFTYATKLFSKANPFFVFAGVAFPDATRVGSGKQYEIILDLALILLLERLLLPSAGAHKRLAYLRGCRETGNSYAFLSVRENQLRLVSIKRGPVIERLLDYFLDASRTHTIGGCIDHLVTSSPSIDQAAAETQVAGLVQLGILSEYIVRDFDHFAADLCGLNDVYDWTIEELQQLHLRCVSKDALPVIHERMKNGDLQRAFGMEELPEDRYYVNVYEDCGRDHREMLTQTVEDDLRRIKPFFSASNFSGRARVIEAFLLDQINGCRNGRLLYLDALCEFLRSFESNVQRYRDASQTLNDASHEWLRRLAESSGNLNTEDLEDLLVQAPPARHGSSTLCFNGSFDYASGHFYVNNILAGDARFASRYLLHWGTRRYLRSEDDRDWLDVQLMPPLSRNRNYVAALLPIGSGFEGRFRHAFERWIDPCSIVVEASDGKIVYRDRDSGWPIRFQFYGFLLAQYLPTEYQLLLVNHADYYLNPFDQLAIDRNSDDSWTHVPPLFHGRICLRREQWLLTRRLLERIWLRGDILASTARLREAIHEAAGADTDDWYYRAVKLGIGGAKPRYLGLRDPLSVQVFQKFAATLAGDEIISLARMEPARDTLYKAEDGRFVTEVMIEV